MTYTHTFIHIYTHTLRKWHLLWALAGRIKCGAWIWLGLHALRGFSGLSELFLKTADERYSNAVCAFFNTSDNFHITCSHLIYWYCNLKSLIKTALKRSPTIIKKKHSHLPQADIYFNHFWFGNTSQTPVQYPHILLSTLLMGTISLAHSSPNTIFSAPFCLKM